MRLPVIRDATAPAAAPRDNELVDRLKAGDDRALSDLIGRYKERIYRFAWRAVGHEEAAVDIAQETFVKAYFKIGTYDPHYKFSTWLFQIALNLCRDHRRRSRHRLRDVSIDHLSSREVSEAWERSDEDVVALAAAREQLGRLRQEIARLPHALRDAFILFALEERSQQECAELLGVTPKSIESRVHRARALLVKKLGNPATL